MVYSYSVITGSAMCARHLEYSISLVIQLNPSYATAFMQSESVTMTCLNRKEGSYHIQVTIYVNRVVKKHLPLFSFYFQPT